MPELVECYSGARYAERPVALRWKSQRLTVREIECQWREPDGPAFRVRTAGGLRFALHYNEEAGTWAVYPLGQE
jgi:hypothetical protein